MNWMRSGILMSLRRRRPLRTRFLQLVLVTVMALLGLFVGGTANATSAHSQMRLLVDHHTRGCLDYTGLTDRPVDTSPCTTTHYFESMMWYGDGTGRLLNYYTMGQTCLDSNAAGAVYDGGCMAETIKNGISSLFETPSRKS